MTVYVDGMLACIKNKNWPYSQNCHLVADSITELHAFAEELGLKRCWFQNKNNNIPHFDLTTNMRKKAVRRGAIEINRKEFVVLMHEYREEKRKE